jgi:hypothetical protein
MVDVIKTYDVFISNSAGDAKLAAEIADTLRANGLDAFTYADLLPSANLSDALWEALAESRALLVVLSPSGLTPSMAIELGAAKAWSKPVFGLVTDPSNARLPSDLSGLRLFTPGRIEEVIRAVKLAGQELSDADRDLLAKAYSEIGISVDQLALQPRHLEKLAHRFSAGTGKSVPGERLLSELLRLRKRGKLAAGRMTIRPKPHRGTA